MKQYYSILLYTCAFGTLWMVWQEHEYVTIPSIHVYETNKQILPIHVSETNKQILPVPVSETNKQIKMNDYQVGRCDKTLSRTNEIPWWIVPRQDFLITAQTDVAILKDLNIMMMPRSGDSKCWDTPVFKKLVDLKEKNRPRPMMLYQSGEVFSSLDRKSCNHLDSVIYRSLENQQSGCPTIHFLQSISHEKQRDNRKTQYYPSQIKTLPKPAPRKKFCALITRMVFRRTHYKVSDALIRHGLARLLSEYKQCERPRCNGLDLDAHKCMTQYKFVITMENTVEEGYFSEKLLNGVLSNAIPIYFGAPDIGKYVNAKRFVLCNQNESFLRRIRKDYKRPHFLFGNFTKDNQPTDTQLVDWIAEQMRVKFRKCINEIIRLDQDDVAYEKKRSQSIWNDDHLFYTSGQYEREQLGRIQQMYQKTWKTDTLRTDVCYFMFHTPELLGKYREQFDRFAADRTMYAVLSGTATSLVGNVLTLDTPDGYKELYLKVQKLLEWIFEQFSTSLKHCNYIVKLDSDSVLKFDWFEGIVQNKVIPYSGYYALSKRDGVRVGIGAMWVMHYHSVEQLAVVKEELEWNRGWGEDTNIAMVLHKIGIDFEPLVPDQLQRQQWFASRDVFSSAAVTAEKTLLHHVPPSATYGVYRQLMGSPLTVTVRLRGRMGNQLFQYMSLMGIANKNGMLFCVKEPKLLPDIVANLQLCSKEQNMLEYQKVKEDGYGMHKEFNLVENTEIDGYLQSYKYFDPNTILQLKHEEEAHLFFGPFKDNIKVGMHVRRGDRVNRTPWTRIPPNSYFEVSMDYFRRQYPDVHFVVASDDYKWCKEQKFLQTEDVSFIDETKELDFMVLKNCDHMILSLGTFGWMAAYLQSGEVVYYSDEMVMEHRINKNKFNPEDYFPPEWIGGNTAVSTSTTIVTAYFDIPSKHTSKEYDKWMSNMLSLQDAMVIYTTNDMVPTIKRLRAHATERTHIVPMELKDMRMATHYSSAFWKSQHAMDPERNHHVDLRLYWIWGEKTELLKRMVDLNPFRSDFFAWVDIGYFRTNSYNGQSMIRTIPPTLRTDQVLMLDVRDLVHQNYVGGGFIGGYAEGLKKWHTKYYAMLDEHKHEFIGKDQPWMWKTCDVNPDLCELVVPDKQRGDPWFYMAPYLAGITTQLPIVTAIVATPSKPPTEQRNYPDPTSEAFVASLYSSEMAPDADAECNIVVSTMGKLSLYDKVDSTKKTPIDTKQQVCPPSTTVYNNGVLTIQGSRQAMVSTVPFDRATKQLEGSGIHLGNYQDPNWQSLTKRETKINSEFVRVKYSDGGGEERFTMAQPKSQVTERNTNRHSPHVLLLVVDNLSRQAATWTLPKTMAFLRGRRENTFVYNRMGSTGHSTAPSLTPILTGKPYDMDKLDRARVRTRRYTPTGIVDADIITSVARANGYVTAYVTDQDDALFVGCYWWDRSWFDHVAPPPGKAGESNAQCLGQFTKHQHGFNYIRSLWDTYEPLQHPVFTYYHASHAHSTPEDAHVLDVDIMLLVKEALARNSVVVLIGDHGSYAQYQSKLPLSTISVPEAFASGHGIGDVAALNQRRLVSQYDLYKTLRFVVSGADSTSDGFGINLLKDRVSSSRGCAEAGIPDFRCFCSVFTGIDTLPSEWKDAVESFINEQAHDVAPQDCAQASVTRVRSVRRMLTCVGQSRFHFHRQCDYDHSPHQHVTWVADVETSLKQNFTVRLSISRVAVSESGTVMPFQNLETDAQRDKYKQAKTRERLRIESFRTSLDSIDVKQLTRYKRYEACTPAAASAQFCVCTDSATEQTTTLLVVAHPDDESIFFGNDLNSSTYVVVVTNADSYGSGAHRRGVFENAMATVGLTNYELWDFPESPNWRISVKAFWSEDTRNAVREKLVHLIRTVKPEQIYTHGRLGEYGHINHREVYDGVHAAFREVFSCDSALADCAMADASMLFTFNPVLDYSNPTNRLKSLPQTCAESAQKKLLLDTYVNQKALTVHNFHKICLGYERLFPNPTPLVAAPTTTPQPPVDIVIPWSGERPGDMSGTNRDDGTIRYTIRSMLKHMPWARTIYIFADPTEPPKWLTEFGDKVQLVNRCAHFIGGQANCPSQNTFAVYANFHTIPDLAEHFIACDDDVIISSPLTREHFFIDGKVVASIRGSGSEIYSGVTTDGGVSYVTELKTPYHDGGKRALPSKLPKQVRSTMHTAFGFLKTEIKKMQEEYTEWFDFVSAHRTRFCFHRRDTYALTQPGNVNGACWHENTKYAIMWFLHSRGLVVAPQTGRGVPEFSVTYEDITKQRLGKALVPGRHATVNINDSTMWRSNNLTVLSQRESGSLAEYAARKRYLQRTLNSAFPLSR